MKFKLLLITFLLLFISSINCQENKDLRILSSKKWYVNSIKFDGNKKVFPKNTRNKNWMFFYENGELESMTYGEKTSEKWKYNKEKNILEITKENNGEITYLKILKIDNLKLILSSKFSDKNVIISLTKVK